MLVTRTGGFPIGFRQGWTEWFKDIDAMVSWTKSQGLGVIDLGGNCIDHLPTMKANGIRVGSVDLQDWHGLISDDPAHQTASLAANEAFIEGENYRCVALANIPLGPLQVACKRSFVQVVVWFY